MSIVDDVSLYPPPAEEWGGPMSGGELPEAPWIQTFTNKVAEPLSLSPECVDIETIAHALSLKVRFNGHCRDLYSVAEHCLLGSGRIAGPFKLAFLLHEVSEVFLPDIPAPIKPFVRVLRAPGFLQTWEAFEAEHADVIFQALGLSSIRSLIDSLEVKDMDQAMLAWEKGSQMGPEPKPWKLRVPPVQGMIRYEQMPENIRQGFLAAYRRYRGNE